MSITGKFKDNQVTLIFDNGTHPNTEIKFQFDNGDDYLLLKNKIEMKIVLNTKRIHNSVNGEIKSTAFFITIKELPQIRAYIYLIFLFSYTPSPTIS